MGQHEILEMIFLTKRKVELLSIEEHIVYEFLFNKRRLNLTDEERDKINKLRESLTKVLIEWGDN